jgi:acylphosphatase
LREKTFELLKTNTGMDPNQLTRYNMQVSGAVQRVGYRHIVQNIARKYNITGCIENLEGYDVHIIAEGSVKDLDAFIHAIKIVEYPVHVDDISNVEEEYKGDYSYFKVIRGSPDEELAERFDTAIAIFSRMEKKQEIALEKHDESISLQKETLTEVKGMRSDLDCHLSKEISEMREELKDIRTALINYGIMTAVRS